MGVNRRFGAGRRGISARVRETSTGILLVGGASTRFGSPKARARLPSGETLAERMWSLLAWCDERVAVGKGGEELPFPVVADDAAVTAPIAGVIAGLRRARTDLCVIVPVDLPALRESDLRSLAAACAQAAVPPSGPLSGRLPEECAAGVRGGARGRPPFAA